MRLLDLIAIKTIGLSLAWLGEPWSIFLGAYILGASTIWWLTRQHIAESTQTEGE